MSDTTEIEPLQTVDIGTAEAPSAPEPPEGERPLTAREQMMDTIVAKREAQLAEEIHRNEEFADAARQSAGIADDDPGTGDQQPDAMRATELPAPRQQHSAPSAPQLIPMDIGNQRVNVTPQQLMELARRGVVATQQVQAQQQAAQAAAYARQAPSQQPQQPLLSDDEAKAFHRRIAFGDSETDGAQAIRELVQSVMSRAPAAPNPTQIASVAREQAVAQMRHEQNLTTLGNEYPDVFENTTLARLAALEYHNLRQEESATGTYRGDLDAYREAASRVRSAIGRGQQGERQSGSQATSAMDASRLERKRAAPRVPTAVSGASTATEQPRRYPTSSQVIEQMRRERGQAPLR